MAKYSTAVAALSLFLAFETALSSSSASSSSSPPANHPNYLELDSKFLTHLKCPYANRWLAKGPEQAARELGLDSQGRRLQEEANGSCTFTNLFSGEATCMEFRGADADSKWTTEEMTARCAQDSGTLVEGAGCAVEAAGWCIKDLEGGSGKQEATAMMLSAMADCAGNKMACETFVGGTFVEDSLCGAESGTESETSASSSSSSSLFDASSSSSAPVTCAIAPGAIGAAHQAAYSSGYLSTGCPDTPAQSSPFMWPLRWSADVESQNMAFGSDDIVFKSKGKTFYSLDNNWKRSDTTFQEGALRALGQGPCEDVDEEFAEQGFLGCLKNQTDFMTTMLHKGNMMYFISYKNDTIVEPGELDVSKIEDCSAINLAVIGNIRPDWFLDKRGDDTDVQFLGNQHVFYHDADDKTIPRLVKQWRKKDFASQYFVMSMMGNPPNKLANETDAPAEDSIHWPMILNIPGEGFGDDSLQVYRNHALLSDDDDKLFMLVEKYQESGGSCVEIGGGGGAGPPILEEDAYIPSNLEVDPNSWYSNEFTFSPIWEVPAKEEMEIQNEASSSGAQSLTTNKAVTQVSDRMTVESCYDETTNSVDLSFHFADIDAASDGSLPWMAIGYRPSEICSMTPIDGGVTPIVLVATPPGETMPQAHSTSLLPEAKSMQPTAFTSMYQLMSPLEESEDYVDVSVEAPMLSSSTGAEMALASSSSNDDVVSLHYKQSVDGGKPEVMHLMFAIGMSSQLGIHETRGCFELEQFPMCKSSTSSLSESESNEDVDGTINVDVKLDGETSPVVEERSNSAGMASISAFVVSSLVLAMMG